MILASRCAVVGGSLLLLAQACGGRSATDFTIYDEGTGGGSGQGGAGNQGGATGSGGSISKGGSIGTGGSNQGGGISTGGSIAVGGFFGTGGAYPAGAAGFAGAIGGTYAFGGAAGFAGTIGAGGFGAGPNGGKVAEACNGFCRPYAELCPGEAGNHGLCAAACVRDLRGRSADCQALAVEALSCLGSVLATQMTCRDGMLAAVLICGGLLGGLECTDEPIPPPNCSGYGTASPNSCALTYECAPDQRYGVQCSVTPNMSRCSCVYNGAFTGQTVTAAGPDPCAEALIACHF